MVQLAHNTVLLISLGILVFTGANAGLIQCPGKIANCGSAQFFQGQDASTGRSQNIVSTSPSSTSNFGGRLEVTVFNQQPTVQNVMHVLSPSVEATVQAAVLKYQQLASSTISNHSQQTLVTTKIMDRLPLSFTTSVRKTLAARIHTVKANKQSFFESASHHSSNQQLSTGVSQSSFGSNQQFLGNQQASFGANQQAFGANQQSSFTAI